MLNPDNSEIQPTLDLAFQSNFTEEEESPIPDVLCGARLVHINMATGGKYYTSVSEDHEGSCNVLDISSPDCLESLAVLPNNKEAGLLAFVALMPDSNYSKILVQATDSPVTHQSYIDWL